ncbi:CBS domain-containing protein [Halovenus marina]|uniref:CBS domain-containing protein n=1 Tax=Halovenus marina TaxID=3396621 RepID=UPI003F57690F
MNADVTIREVMNREYVGVNESDELVGAVELLLREGSETAVVLRGSDPVGLLTERDVFALLVEGPDPASATVSDATTTEVPAVSPETTLDVAADTMATHSVRRLRVTEGDELIGIVTEHDIVSARAPRDTTTDMQAEITETPATATTAMASEGADTDFEDQSICEGCGSLAHDLVSFNGQLLCADCRDM